MADFPIKTININDQNYPKLLRQLIKPPKVLYYRGLLDPQSFNIAVVGSRKMSVYGQQATESLIKGFSGMPISIISGLAFGVDAHAHLSAINNRLHTVAVLGCGPDDQSIYPRANLRLARKILENGGGLVSTFPPGTKALEWHFPARNEIISGMSEAVIIIEAAEKSGALITADFALNQNRGIYAVPGSIFQNSSAGTNNLIKTGSAKLVSNAADIIIEHEQLQGFTAGRKQQSIDPNLSEMQRLIIENIGAAPLNLTELCKRTNLPIAALNSQLAMLEIKNKIRSLGNDCYALNLTS